MTAIVMLIEAMRLCLEKVMIIITMMINIIIIIIMIMIGKIGSHEKWFMAPECNVGQLM